MPGSQPEPLTAQDRLDIAELVASYARCLDTGDIEGYVNLFAPDGVLDGQAGPRRGHDAIRKVAEATVQVGVQPGPAQGQRHFTGQPVVSGDRRSCEVRTYFLLIRQTPDAELLIRAMGEYLDTCTQHDGRWVFARREIRLLLGRFGAS